MYLDKSIEKIKNLNAFEDWELKGCSDQEIQALEQELTNGLTLPGAYVEFLQFCGHGLGFMLEGDDFYYPHVLRMQRQGELKSLMESDRFNGSLKELFCPDMFMIYQHHGGEFVRFIRLTEEDNPTVYYFEDATNFNSYRIQEDHFSSYFLFEVEKYVEIHKNLVLDSPQILQNKIIAYKQRLHELVDLLALINERYPRYINNYLFERYNSALQNIYTLFMPHRTFYKSDFLISATTKFLEENQELPEKEVVAGKMEDSKKLAREIFSFLDQ
ncbi:hypothetical protein NIES4074_00800 [Cylindrospermum sp. NIES-4074]|nr:hypothetical protein NIES4074_00800 [Cylindrospermum sp. NIES-4074]